MDFASESQKYISKIELWLRKYTESIDAPEITILNAVRYSLMSGGKRLRPVMFLASSSLLGLEDEIARPYACAIEMIHTYSLIHDDLPAMDDDDTRRGKPSNHIAFGEGMAVLAGDALLNMAFEVMSADAKETNDNKLLRRKIDAAAYIGNASG
jgi:geranylgeranyl diphosphate synthase type II